MNNNTTNSNINNIQNDNTNNPIIINNNLEKNNKFLIFFDLKEQATSFIGMSIKCGVILLSLILFGIYILSLVSDTDAIEVIEDCFSIVGSILLFISAVSNGCKNAEVGYYMLELMFYFDLLKAIVYLIMICFVTQINAPLIILSFIIIVATIIFLTRIYILWIFYSWVCYLKSIKS